MRAIWKGAVAFGLVNVPVKLYAATGERSVPLHQVHAEDGGRIRYRKVCSVDGEEIPYDQIAKGYETDDGRMVVLTDEDLDDLPISTEREIAVEEFVPADRVDPIMLGKTYYLEPERTAAKPYALLREALKTTDRMAVVKVALRQKETMAVLRVRDDVICLQTLLWPDEIRAAEFPILEAEVQVRPQELQMAASLVESLAGDFDPSDYSDAYRQALEAVIEAKVTTGRTVSVKHPEREEDTGGEVVDLLSALQRSVERARGRREGADDGAEAPQEKPAPRRSSRRKADPEPAPEAAPEKEAAPARRTSRASSAKAGTKSSTTKPAAAGTGGTPSSRRGTGKPAGTSTAGPKAGQGKAKATKDDDAAAPARKTTRRRAS
ncbi:DNA repair protein [Actinotalea ferrariae CF5-4]|uniref:Non-homologous end joining protein Ku n=1 Tax=Actinotalea ferrariae CF5-4 TaxID=948458 RepID=A0A021VLR6_9CELL|nr:Ku protein [Actinotalea ferrariae]EYR62028.1 DNA repair protein [Actinotalea ferrariae CF5-4]